MYNLIFIKKNHSALIKAIDGKLLALKNITEKIEPLEVASGNQVLHTIFDIIQFPI